MADPVKHVVSVLKTALDQIQGQGNININDVQQPSTSAIPVPVNRLSADQSQSQQSRQFVDAPRRDFSLSFPSLGGGGKRMPLTNRNRENKKTKVVVFQPRKSWTHDFCLLSDQSRSVTPSISQLSKLKDAGLGRKRIVFPDKKALFVKVKSILETEYPKLKSQDGAFEFMRAESRGNSDHSV